MTKSNILNCKNCDEQIYFDDEVLSKNGKKIPIEYNENRDPEYDEPKYHDCPNSTFRRTKP